jgi:hypothetical protein
MMIMMMMIARYWNWIKFPKKIAIYNFFVYHIIFKLVALDDDNYDDDRKVRQADFFF